MSQLLRGMFGTAMRLVAPPGRVRGLLAQNMGGPKRPSLAVLYLCVAGGGGGGGAVDGSSGLGGGGGAGGLLTGTMPGFSLSEYTITVGAGGAADVNGQPSAIAPGVSTLGGGFGGAPVAAGGDGGSGGGASNGGAAGGLGTSGQGNDGGNTVTAQGIGGGAGGAGSVGGPGLASSITGASVTYAAGGSYSTGPTVNGGANTGNGGRGARGGSGGGFTPPGAGGSGIVVFAYLTGAYEATGGTKTVVGLYTIHTFTASGVLTVRG